MKYMGSKNKIAKEIVPIIQSVIHKTESFGVVIPAKELLRMGLKEIITKRL